MENEGKIFAFDRDRKRYDMLKQGIERNNAKCASATHRYSLLWPRSTLRLFFFFVILFLFVCFGLFARDFLHVNPLDDCYSKVQAILVDPSCSGTGTISHIISVIYFLFLQLKCTWLNFNYILQTLSGSLCSSMQKSNWNCYATLSLFPLLILLYILHVLSTKRKTKVDLFHISFHGFFSFIFYSFLISLFSIT